MLDLLRDSAGTGRPLSARLFGAGGGHGGPAAEYIERDLGAWHRAPPGKVRD